MHSLSDRKPLDGLSVSLTLVICGIWSLQQVVIKAAAPDMFPIMQVAVRSACAALLAVPLLLRRGEGLLPRGEAWKAGMASGILFGLEYLLVGEALRFTSASHVVVFLYTAPAFAALGLHWKLPEERMNAVQWLGMILAFGGIVVTFYGRDADGGSAALLGDALALLGGVAWGATTVVIRCTELARTPPMQTMLCQLLGACILLFPAAAVMGQTAVVLTPVVWASLAFNVFLMSFGSLIVWFWLLRNYLASQLGVLLFVTPVFGVAAGVLLLGETVEPRFALGAALVIAGIALVSGRRFLAGLFRKAG